MKEIRKFGTIAVLFFGALFALSIWRERVGFTYFFGILGTLGLGLLIFPKRLAPIYKGWMKVGHGIGQGITILLMTFAYYVVITPAALIKRILGGRPLPLAPDRSCSSYWVTRQEPGQEKARFTKRF